MKAVKNTIFAPHAVDPGQVEQIWHLKMKLFSSLNFIGPHKIQLARTSVYLPGLQLTSSCFLLFSLLHSETSWEKKRKERSPVTFIIRRRGPINIWRTGECSNLTVIKILKGIKLFIKSDFRLVMPHVCWMSNERLIACNFTIAALLRASDVKRSLSEVERPSDNPKPLGVVLHLVWTKLYIYTYILLRNVSIQFMLKKIRCELWNGEGSNWASPHEDSFF